jgi:hypothetical protein
MQCANESALVDHLQEQNVTMYTVCMCDPETLLCVHPDIVNAILSAAHAGIIAAVFTALPAGVVVYYMFVVRSSAPVLITLVNQVIDLCTDVFYTCRSQYGSLALLNVHLILLVTALLPYVCIVILSGRALRAPKHHGAYARLHFVLSSQSKPRAALAAFLQRIVLVSRVLVLVGPLLWKAEVLIMPAGWSWFTGEETPAADDAAHEKTAAAADVREDADSSKGVFDPRMYHIRVLSSWLLQSLPMIVVQCLNNNKLTEYGVDGWDATACIPMASSAVGCACGLYTMLQQLRKHGFALHTWDMPILDSWGEMLQKGVAPALDAAL